MQTHDVGQAMIKTLACLVKDAHADLGSNIFSRFQNIVKQGNVRAIREYKFPSPFYASPYIFKWTAQLEGWLKRFRFENDVYTETELQDITIDKFLSTQLRLPSSRPVSASCNAVLREARKITREILGSYDLNEHIQSCRFGSKAAKGVPMKQGFLDLRLRTLTGSAEHIKWFHNHCYTQDSLLSAAIREVSNKKKPAYIICDDLDLFNVPKTWKSLRSIMPNTTIGNFYSNGLGDVIAKRLKSSGLNISRLQTQHKELARKASLTRKLVTADLSSASDSFTVWLVNALVPREWFRALNYGRIRYCRFSTGERQMLQSFMTMGIGFTFPLQTLLFYSILKAIGRLLNVPGEYSVYGDDLIYPRKIHKYVESTLNKLGFQLNNDKTFVRTSFRESCGGDYFRGVDVRPCNPIGQQQRVGRQAYCSFLYKLANGLIRRWDTCEISSTMYYLLKEIIATDFKILQVPPFFPDTSGLHTLTPVRSQYFSEVVRHNAEQSFSFKYLKDIAQRRIVVHQRAYLWDCLRDPSVDEQEIASMYTSLHRDTPLLHRILDFIRERRPEKYFKPKRERLLWLRLNQKKSCPRRAKQATCVPMVVVPSSSHLVKQTGQTSAWS